MEMTPDTTDFNSLSKKQLVELVVAKYNDCFRLEEENKKPKEEIINNAKDYVKLFKKYAVTSILLLISLIMNFILIIL